MKRIVHSLKIVLTALFIIMISPVTSFADGRDYGEIVNKQITVDNLGYSLTEDNLTAMLNIGFDAYGDIVIPSKVRYNNKDYTVNAIGGSAFGHNIKVMSITMPNTIQFIGSGAFAWCSNLKSIQLSEKLIELGHSAFNGTSIEEITIPMGVKEITQFTFDCNNLKTIKVLNPNTIIYTNALPTTHKVEVIGGIVKEYKHKYKVLDKDGNLIGYREEGSNKIQYIDR